MCVVKAGFVRGFESLRETTSVPDRPPIVVAVWARRTVSRAG